jgi:hypothetical protein
MGLAGAAKLNGYGRRSWQVGQPPRLKPEAPDAARYWWTIIELSRWSDQLATMPPPGRRVKVKIHCASCARHHVLM